MLGLTTGCDWRGEGVLSFEIRGLAKMEFRMIRRNKLRKSPTFQEGNIYSRFFRNY